jgi:hypothetical protein
MLYKDRIDTRWKETFIPVALRPAHVVIIPHSYELSVDTRRIMNNIKPLIHDPSVFLLI